MIVNKIVQNTLGVAAVALVLAACSKKAEEVAVVDVVEPAVVAEAPVEAVVEEIKETLILESTEMVSEKFTVESFDMATRTAVLMSESGDKRSVTAGPEATNLDQVKPGVQVLVEFLKTISIEVINDKNLEPTVVAINEVERAAEGEPAAAGAIEGAVVIFKIEDINLENNTFKLKGPDGIVKQYQSQNPENLKKGTVGDSVILTVAEAVAISIVDAK